MRHTFSYNGRQSYINYGVTVESIQAETPQPKKVEVEIPFRSSAIDMDEVIGYPTYADRTITVKFWKRCINREAVKKLASDINTWLMSDFVKKDFTDSDESLYIYKAYCSKTEFSESTNCFMRCTATFKASPYRIHKQTGKEVI